MEEPEKHFHAHDVSADKAKKSKLVTGTMDDWMGKLFRTRRRTVVTLATAGIVLLAIVAPLAYRSFAATNGYDLVVTKVMSSPAYPLPGQDVTFSATIKNMGNVATPVGVAHGVSFSVNGTKVAWSDTYKNGLAPGASVTVTANGGPDGNSTWSFPGGKTDVEAYADDINRLSAETNGDNNKLTFQFAYDLVVTAIGVNPANPVAGNRVIFSATVKNAGNLPTPSGIVHGVAFQIAGKSVSWSDTYKTGISPGTSVTLTANSGPSGVNYWTMVAGTSSVTAFADDVNRLADESNGDNNKLTGSLATATTPPAPAPAPAPSPTPSPVSSGGCSGTGNAKNGNTRGGLYGFASGFRYGQLSATDRDKYMNAAQNVGAKWMRMNMESYNMAQYKDFVSKAKARGMCVLGQFGGNSSGNHWGNPPDHQAWAKQQADMVAQLKGDVHVWEVWNEPNLNNFWNTGVNPQQYADLLHRTYLAVKAVDPNAVVLTGGLAPSGDGSSPFNAVNYWKSVYNWNKSQGRQGSSQLFDGIAHHPYYYPGDPTASDKLKDWSGYYQTYLIHQNVMCNASYGGPTNDCAKKVWGTEGGGPTNCSLSSCVSPATMSTYFTHLMDKWINEWGSFTGPYMTHQLQNQPGAPSTREGFMGIINTDFSPKQPLYDTIKAYNARTN